MCTKECGNCKLFSRFNERVLNEEGTNLVLGEKTQNGKRTCTEGGTANATETCIAPTEFQPKDS